MGPGCWPAKTDGGPLGWSTVTRSDLLPFHQGLLPIMVAMQSLMAVQPCGLGSSALGSVSGGLDWRNGGPSLHQGSAEGTPQSTWSLCSCGLVQGCDPLTLPLSGAPAPAAWELQPWSDGLAFPPPRSTLGRLGTHNVSRLGSVRMCSTHWASSRTAARDPGALRPMSSRSRFGSEPRTKAMSVSSSHWLSLKVGVVKPIPGEHTGRDQQRKSPGSLSLSLQWPAASLSRMPCQWLARFPTLPSAGWSTLPTKASATWTPVSSDDQAFKLAASCTFIR